MKLCFKGKVLQHLAEINGTGLFGKAGELTGPLFERVWYCLYHTRTVLGL